MGTRYRLVKAQPFWGVRDLVPYFSGVYHNQFLLCESIARANEKTERLPLNLVCCMDSMTCVSLTSDPNDSLLFLG